MTWIVVAIAQLVVGWLAMRFQPDAFFVTVNNYYLISGALGAVFVWLAGLVLSFVFKDIARPTISSLGATVVVGVLVAAFIQDETLLGLTGVLDYLPSSQGRPGLVLLCAVAAYWAVGDLTKLPFNPVFVPSLVVGIFGAVVGVYAGSALLYALVPTGSYPRILLAIPIIAGGLIGFVLGAGLVVGIITLFRFAGRARPA